MAILDKEGFLSAIKARLGTDASDDAVKFLEDMTDTYNHLAELSADNGDWKAKHDALDATWRQRYMERFFTAGPDVNQPPTPPAEPNAQAQPEHETPAEPEETTYDDLFEEVNTNAPQT